MKREPISEATRTAVLNATWSLMAEKKRLDVSLSEIAAAAGVSRQTLYFAFGDRAGLLAGSPQPVRRIRRSSGTTSTYGSTIWR
jgi:AcrR family transcriptional regulator